MTMTSTAAADPDLLIDELLYLTPPGQRLGPRTGLTSRGELLRALLTGLSSEEQAWVGDRIRHYRALAATEAVSEGRL